MRTHPPLSSPVTTRERLCICVQARFTLFRCALPPVSPGEACALAALLATSLAAGCASSSPSPRGGARPPTPRADGRRARAGARHRASSSSAARPPSPATSSARATHFQEAVDAVRPAGRTRRHRPDAGVLVRPLREHPALRGAGRRHRGGRARRTARSPRSSPRSRHPRPPRRRSREAREAVASEPAVVVRRADRGQRLGAARHRGVPGPRPARQDRARASPARAATCR